MKRLTKNYGSKSIKLEKNGLKKELLMDNVSGINKGTVSYIDEDL